MRVLVTGAAGFLGRHVTRRLIADGFEVTAFDLVDVGMLEARSVLGDLRDAEAVAGAVAGHDVVVHIGAIGDVYLAGEQPELAAAVNVTGSANIAAAALQAGARVVNASTWEVYGEPTYQPLDEEHPSEPDHPYNITKLAGEQILLAADHLRGLPVISLRLGTAYGTGLRPNSVFRIFIDRARRGDPITIQGDGKQGRQFTHASDIARAFSMACRSEARGSGTEHGGSGNRLDQGTGRTGGGPLPDRADLRRAPPRRRPARPGFGRQDLERCSDGKPRFPSSGVCPS